MVKFEVLESTIAGHKLVWENRRYLMKLALVPVIIKIVCFMLVVAYGWERDFVRQALVMLPSYFADGWMLAHFVRLIYFNQTWPYRPSGDKKQDMITLHEKARGVMAGTVMYTLFKFLTGGYLAVAFLLLTVTENTPQDQIPAYIALLALIIPLFALWAFRLLWFFIPAAANIPVFGFMKAMKGLLNSIPLLAIWFLCFFPLFFLLSIIASTFTTPDQVTATMSSAILFNILRVFVDTGVALLATASIAIAFGNIYKIEKCTDSSKEEG